MHEESVHTISNAVLGCAFWCVLHGLGPMIWFYPLNELEISGFEVFAVGFLSPVFLLVPSVSSTVATNRYASAFLHLLQLVGLASFQAPSTLLRLVSLAVGVASALLLVFVQLRHPSTRDRQIEGLLLGFVALVGARVWFASFSPAWWTPATNSACVALTAVATVDRLISDVQEKPPPTKQVSAKTATSSTTTAGLSEPRVEGRLRGLVHGLAFGALLFLLQWVGSEVGLITRWTVTPHPSPGPQPWPHGILTLLAIFAGVKANDFHPSLARSHAAFVLATLALFALYLIPGYPGFTAGLVIVFWSCLQLKPALLRLSCQNRLSPLIAMVFYLVLMFGFVWCVAYNFVPGGSLTRERTDMIIVFTMTAIGSSCFIHQFWGSICDGFEKKKLPASVLLMLLLCSLSGFGYRAPLQRVRPPAQQKGQPHLTTMIWTYHFGYDNRGWPSLERSAQLMNDTGADVITLLESDASKPFLGNNDLGLWLSERLGMYLDYGPGTNRHCWGNLVLSRYPIVHSEHYLLPAPHGERAPGVKVTIDMGSRGGLVDVLASHFGLDTDHLDRKLQAEFMAELSRNCSNPVVLMAYITSEPGSANYRQIVDRGQLTDIDTSDHDRWCQYIMYRNLTRLGYARITHGGLTDTEVQLARFGVGWPEGDRQRLTTDPGLADPAVRFNEKWENWDS